MPAGALDISPSVLPSTGFAGRDIPSPGRSYLATVQQAFETGYKVELQVTATVR